VVSTQEAEPPEPTSLWPPLCEMRIAIIPYRSHLNTIGEDYINIIDRVARLGTHGASIFAFCGPCSVLLPAFCFVDLAYSPPNLHSDGAMLLYDTTSNIFWLAGGVRSPSSAR